MNLPNWFRNLRRREADLDDELNFHLRMDISGRVERGERHQEARDAALREFGNTDLVKAVTRDMWGWATFERLWQEFRFAGRMVWKNPGFSLVVMLTLALGIGANTAIFSVVRAALSPLDIPDPGRVVIAWTENPKRNWHQFPVSVPDFLDWKASGVFTSLSAFDDGGVNLRIGGAAAERTTSSIVTPEFFRVIAHPPLMGRVFEEDDVRPGRDKVLVLTENFWRSRFASDPAIVGKTVILDGAPHTIVGVLPKSFPRFGQEQLYTPFVFDPAVATKRGDRFFGAVGRLRPDISLAAAQTRMDALEQRLARQFPNEDGGNGVSLQLLQENVVQDSKILLTVLFAAVGFVLFIACANIANLLLARGTTRAREMALRAALGASRWALARQLLTESVLLAMLGGVLAIAPAYWGTHFIASFELDQLPNPELITISSGVLAFNIALSLLTGVLFGLVPAWQVWRTDVNDTLKASSRSLSGGLHQRLRGVFVISEVALTMVLLIGAGLMVHSVVNMRSITPGYRSEGVLTMRVSLSDAQYSDPGLQTAYFEKLAARAATLPGVRSAAAINGLPTSSELHGAGLFFTDRPDPRPEDIPVVLRHSVIAGYFETMRIPLVRGRFFSASDRKDSPLAVIIDDYAAKRYWPNQDPIGKRVKLGAKQPPREIVGVVGAVDQSSVVKLLKGQLGQIYIPFPQEPKPYATLVVRTDGDPKSLAAPLRDAARAVDVDQPVFEIQTMDEARAAGQATQRLVTWLLGGFSLLALLLAAIGIYGVIAYNVGQRTREFGIRMSLGAPRNNVLGLVVRQGALLAAVGAVVGLAGAFGLTRLMASLLYGVKATDPITFAAVSVLFAGVAIAASYIPARRATKVDPVTALRCE
jgi:putative ABC transport system permease protein